MNANGRSAGARVVDLWPVGWPLPLTARARVFEWDEAMAGLCALVEAEPWDAGPGAPSIRTAVPER